MDVKIKITQQVYDSMIHRLFPTNDPLEQFGFIAAGLSRHESGCNLLCRKFFFADKSCLIRQTGVSVIPDPRFVRYVWDIVKASGGVLITVHTHPFAKNHVSFSGIDDASEAQSFPKEVAYLGEGPHANIVLGTNSIDARWYDAKTKNVSPVREFKIIGDRGVKILKPTSLIEQNTDQVGIEEVYNRQVLALGKAGQNLLQKQKVAVVGCGGIGSIICILLVRLGVRDLVLIDHDVVEHSNLNRLAGSRLLDAQKGIFKVQMLARYAKRINPAVRIKQITDSVFSSEAQMALKSCDYIFGGTDNQSTRDLLNTIAAGHLIPFIDCGTGLQADSNHNIEHAGGQVRTVIPGLGCLKCINGINMDLAKMEQLPKEQQEGMVERGYIAGADEHAPAVASLNGAIANMAVTEFMGHVTGCKSLSRYVYYNFLKPLVVPVEFTKKPDCFSCSEDTLLGCGDNGLMLPEYVVSCSKEDNNHFSKGDLQMKKTIESVEQFLQMAKDRSLNVNGSAEDLCFVINGLQLDPRFTVPQTKVMIKIRPEQNDALILIPEEVSIRDDAGISCDFIGTAHPMEWKGIFPNTFLDINGEILELVFSVAGMLANLSLYNVISPKAITKPADTIPVEVTRVQEGSPNNSSLAS